MTFKELNLSEKLLKVLIEVGHETPTSIQALAIPHILKKEDVLGCAKTGTGKTAAFVLPILEDFMNKGNKTNEIKVLVLSPTRELAIQTRDNFKKYGKYTNIRCGVVLGGVNQRSQEEVLRRGLDVLVATPGRLIDLVNQRIVKLNAIETLVLDEADTMLDMGFIHDIRKIVQKVPKNRQTLMFSATMPSSIRNLSKEFLDNPTMVEVDSKTVTVDEIDQSVYFVDTKNKISLLLDLLRKEELKSTLIFTRTKHKANKLSETLSKNNIYCEVIHGNKSQNSRISALNSFKNGKSKILIATDIAARGIDISELYMVINFELPESPESYVHRIGRTGRAGRTGKAISFCDRTEKKLLTGIEKLIKRDLHVEKDHIYKEENNMNNNTNKNKKRH